ncbi:MAG: diguanylate cyclase [Chloroflexota bacterium]|nr:diguanylate cyclase [Chloroflexota bacterium]
MLVSSAAPETAVVLVIDSEPANQRAMRAQLMQLGYTARSADDYESAAAILQATPPDVVLMTGTADDEGGWEELQEQLDTWGIPLLRLTSEVENLSTGPLVIADSDLKERLDEALQKRKVHEVLITENARMSAERLYDPLTGLFNRRYMMIRVEEEVKRSARHAYPLSCLILNIDKFDAVNENFGQLVGDNVLRDVSHIIMRTLRATDIVARYRDDQFIALLTDTDPSGAQVAGNRLRDAVAGQQFAGGTEENPVSLTASVGVAYWQPTARPGEGTWEPQLIALAERALRAAKLSGVNRLVMLQAA